MSDITQAASPWLYAVPFADGHQIYHLRLVRAKGKGRKFLTLKQQQQFLDPHTQQPLPVIERTANLKVFAASWRSDEPEAEKEIKQMLMDKKTPREGLEEQWVSNDIIEHVENNLHKVR